MLVVPDAHHGNLYDLPSVYGHAVHDLVREVAIAIWHDHVHVFPRYIDDELYGTRPYAAFRTPAERRPYADKLRAYFTTDASAPTGVDVGVSE